MLKVAHKTAASLKLALKSNKDGAGNGLVKKDSQSSEYAGGIAAEVPILPAELVSVASSVSLSYLSCHEACVEEVESPSPVSECSPELTDGSVALYPHLNSVLDDHSEHLLRHEKRAFGMSLHRGMRFKFKGPHGQRMNMADWLSYLASASGYSRKTLHVAMTYLDLFLIEYSKHLQKKHIHFYAFACLSFASMTQGKAHMADQQIPEYIKRIFENIYFKQAEADIFSDGHLGLGLLDSGDGPYVVQTMELPTVIDFLELNFQRAATALPERFGDQHALKAAREQTSNVYSYAKIPRLYAVQPFVHACDIADMLLHNQNTQRFPGSQLAAACFYIVAEHDGIENSMLKTCTGYAASEIAPAVYRVRALLKRLYGKAGLDIGAKQCCSGKARYKYYNGEVKPEQRWSLQPFHCYMLAKFQNADIRARRLFIV
ncbi:hypothetical protein LPJ57_004956 [Coemansia sp. RSA 486]|nr:hypothetical protein LPJ57_004956 [Coemansia sp. RSA 486]